MSNRFEVAGSDGFSSKDHPTRQDAYRAALLHLLPEIRHPEVKSADRKRLEALWAGAHQAGYRLYRQA